MLRTEWSTKGGTGGYFPFSTDFPFAQHGWPLGDAATRARIFADHKWWTQAMLFYLGKDPELRKLQPGLVQEAASFGLCADEYTTEEPSTGHWTPQLYVRESVRLKGAKVLTQKDICEHEPSKTSVGISKWGIDIHAERRVAAKVKGSWRVVNAGGRDGGRDPAPFCHTDLTEIPYEALTPRRNDTSNLLVPVCVSSTHMAFATYRLEAQYAIFGHSSGAAAALALKQTGGPTVQDVDVAELQALLLSQKQLLKVQPSKTTSLGAGSNGWNSPAIDSLPESDILDLGGDSWSVRATAGPGEHNCSANVKARVPGDIYTDLHAAGVIGDPLGAFGDFRTAWAGRTSWSYSRTFSVSAAQLAASGSALLVFEGIETNASVLLNGKAVLTADDSWLTYTVAAHKLLKAGTNTLEVSFASVYDVCEFSDPFHSNVTCPGRVFVRQAASSWGWDWANRFSPQGIWRPGYIAFVPKASAAITGLSAIVRPAAGEPAAAKKFLVDVTVNVHASAAMAQSDLSVSGDWGGAKHSISLDTALKQGDNTLSAVLEAQDVDLWWPTGLGEQKMYSLTARVSGSEMSRKLGFRTSRLQTDSGMSKEGERVGSGNSSMILVVNGVRVLVRGSSLVPLDTFNGRTSAAATRRMLVSVRDANMNALRIWGGGTFRKSSNGLLTTRSSDADRCCCQQFPRCSTRSAMSWA